MCVPELTYTDICNLIIVLIASLIIVPVIGGIWITSDGIRCPKWMRRKKKPSRAALIAENVSISEENELLRRENALLTAENYRLRRLTNGTSPTN